jgi:hypothetical protein
MNSMTSYRSPSSGGFQRALVSEPQLSHLDLSAGSLGGSATGICASELEFAPSSATEGFDYVRPVAAQLATEKVQLLPQ